MSDEKPVIDMKEVIEQCSKAGKPLIIIEPTATSEEVVAALKKIRLEDTKRAMAYYYRLKPLKQFLCRNRPHYSQLFTKG